MAHHLSPERPNLADKLKALLATIKDSEPKLPAPPHIHLLNSIFMLLADHVTCARAWAFYLFSPEFDDEPELRNRLGCIWLYSLLDSLEAEESVLPGYELQCRQQGLSHLLRMCERVRAFLVPVKE